jgi:hypothetical protein
MGISLFLILLMLPAAWPSWQQLITMVASGVGIYITLMIVLGVPAWKELTDILQERWLARRRKKLANTTTV